jgi:hypothetical protein
MPVLRAGTLQRRLAALGQRLALTSGFSGDLLDTALINSGTRSR